MASGDYEYDVLCYGTISADNLIYVPFLPTPRRDSQVLEEFRRLGGEAVTVAQVLSHWGMRVAIVGNAIGDDYWGQFILQQLKCCTNIDRSYLVQRSDVRTPICRILVTPDGERSILGYWFDDAPKTQLTEEIMAKARLLSVDVYGKDERNQAARVARQLGRTVVTADAIWPDYSLAGLSDINIISQVFLYRYFPGVYIYDHVLELQEAGAGEIIVTQGEEPVLVVDRVGKPRTVRTFPVRAQDTTGAGDVFKAAVIYGNLQGWDIYTSTRFACAAASLHIGSPRGLGSVPDLDTARRMAEA